MRKYLFPIVLLGTVVGCGGGEEGGSGVEIVPLAIGNWWLTADTAGIQDTNKMVVETTATWLGRSAYLVLSCFRDTDTTYMWYQGDYLWVSGVTHIDTMVDTMVLAYLLRAPFQGASWTVYRDTLAGADTLSEFIIIGHVEGREDVSVPAGDFPESWKFRHEFILNQYVDTALVESETGSVFIWAYPGVGIVKEYHDYSGSTPVLIDYDVSH